MGIQELIYGPRRGRPHGLLPAPARPSVVDMDTVRDFADRACELLDGLRGRDEPRSYVEFRANNVLVPRDDLDNLSIVNRNRLMVNVRCGERSASVGFYPHMNPTVDVIIINDPLALDQTQRALQDILLDGNRPVFRPARFLPMLPSLAVAVLLALWIWVVISVPLAPAALTLGWVLMAAIAGVGFWSAGRVRQRAEMMANGVGNRVRGETRAKTIARRADVHANVKVSLITFPIGVVAGVLLAFATKLFGLGTH